MKEKLSDKETNAFLSASKGSVSDIVDFSFTSGLPARGAALVSSYANRNLLSAANSASYLYRRQRLLSLGRRVQELGYEKAMQEIGEWPSENSMTRDPSQFMQANLNNVKAAQPNYPEAGVKRNPTNKAGVYYDSPRGIIRDAKYPDRRVVFQYHPIEINDTKKVVYDEKNYVGYQYNKIVYINGAGREVIFNLVFDATSISIDPDSLPTESIKQKHNEYMEQSGYEFAQWGGTREEGVLPVVNRLQSFMYAQKAVDNETQARFYRGQFAPIERFEPPPIVEVFFGDRWYLKGAITNAVPKYTVMREIDGIPLRAEVSITLRVDESDVINKTPNYVRPISGLRNLGQTDLITNPSPNINTLA